MHKRRTALLALLGLALMTPTALAQEPATGVTLAPHETVTVTWSGAAGQSWAVVIIGPKGAQALPIATKTRVAVDFTDIAGIAQWGDKVTAYVAPCASPAESYDVAVATTTTWTPCTPTPGWASSMTKRLQGPPDLQLDDRRTRGTKFAWVVSKNLDFAPTTGFVLRWRVDACPAATSVAQPCPGRNRWKRTTLAAGVRSFAIPGARSGTYWDIQLIATSEAGPSQKLDVGLYVS